jgi:hypothetical protein
MDLAPWTLRLRSFRSHVGHGVGWDKSFSQANLALITVSRYPISREGLTISGLRKNSTAGCWTRCNPERCLGQIWPRGHMFMDFCETTASKSGTPWDRDARFSCLPPLNQPHQTASHNRKNLTSDREAYPTRVGPHEIAGTAASFDCGDAPQNSISQTFPCEADFHRQANSTARGHSSARQRPAGADDCPV